MPSDKEESAHLAAFRKIRNLITGTQWHELNQGCTADTNDKSVLPLLFDRRMNYAGKECSDASIDPKQSVAL